MYTSQNALRYWFIVVLGMLVAAFSPLALAARPQITILHHMSGNPDLQFRELSKKIGEQLNVGITTIGAYRGLCPAGILPFPDANG
jgi:hypothetical protein